MDYKEIFEDPTALLETLKKADKKTRKTHGLDVNLERAILLSWWCDRGSCSFCYMSTQKKRIQDKNKGRRRRSSILAEGLLLKRIGWRVAFLSGGYGAYSLQEIKEIAEHIKEVMGEATWLNVGVLSRKEMTPLVDTVEGVVGSVETVNEGLRKKICPGKPLEPITSMFEDAEDLGLKKGMTVILGLGETVEDLQTLLDFVGDHKTDKITVYSLNPHEGTPLHDHPPPASLYQAGVIASLRLKFPDLKIVAGTWIDQLPNIGVVLLAGANGITKYPLYRMFGNRYGKKVEEEISFAGRRVVGTFTDLSRLNGDHEIKAPEKTKIEAALDRYIQKIKSGVSQ
jgi:biotin synthase-like enzyme